MTALRLLAATTVIALLTSCGEGSLPKRTIQVGEVSVTVEVAANTEDRARGLKFRDSMGANTGMLFIYPDIKVRRFWMKDTRIPLSIAFADESGKIVKLAEMQPMDTDGTPSLYPAKYALEMNKGWFTENGIEKGQMITGIPADLTVE